MSPSDLSEPEGGFVPWLNPHTICAQWDAEAARLSVQIGDSPTVHDVEVRLAFPLSRPDQFLELTNAKGELLGMLAALGDLEAETERALRAALVSRYMVPRITRIVEVAERSPFVLQWRVETNRGERVFRTESPREAIHYLGSHRLRITDLAGVQYDIPDVSTLDSESRTILGRFL